MSLSIVATGAALGAEIAGVDLTRSIDDVTYEQIRQAFYRYEVIFFRGRELSDEDQIRYSARFGRLRRLKPATSQRTTFHDERHPEISVVSNILKDGKLIGSNYAGLFWHTDGNCLPNPYVASLLRALEV